MRRNRNASLFESLERRQLLAAGFQIEMVFDASVNSTVRSLINAAVNTWQSVITGDIADVGAGAWGAAVDDVRINASVITIDGTNGTVAQGRPTYLRNSNKLPIAGEIQVDTADISSTLANGTLSPIIKHEIAHALGFGTIWDIIGGYTNGSTTDPQYIGQNALDRYRAISGLANAVSVPLENTGNTGTFGTHWRESHFDTELMTGYIDPTGNELSAITVGAMQDLGYEVNYSAANSYYIPGSLGSIAGKVWNDLDGSGTQNGSEVGMQSTTVYIDANNNGAYDVGEKNTQSTSSGSYNFTNLTPGTYRVRVLVSTGFTQTYPSNNAAQIISLGFADNRTNINFGIRQQSTATASIRGTAWKDTDLDGVLDSGESEIQGRVIYIDADNDGILDSGEQQTITDQTGAYSLAGLVAGTYNVRQVLPSGWNQTFPFGSAAQVVTVTNGQAVTGKNFGSVQGTVSGASISGTVWKDSDRDGLLDSNESMLQSRVVYIDADNDGNLDSSEAQTLSNAAGLYSFTNLPAGTYRIRQVVPTNWLQSYPASNGAHVVTVTSSQAVTNRNFGSYENVMTGSGSIRGKLWHDVNSNMVIDSGEAGLAGRTVFIDADNDKVFDAGEVTSLTSSTGDYAFTNLLAGIYYIRQVLPSGWVQTYPTNNYSQKITLNTGVNITQRNFGSNGTSIPETGSIKGSIWNDLDHDGVWDSNEVGLSGRTVYIDADNDGALDSGEVAVTTNSSGLYTLSNLPAGTYRVRQVLPSNWNQSYPTSNASQTVTLTTGANVTGRDFGAYGITTNPGTGSIKGTVWNDLDHDGTWDSNEVGIAGRTVFIDADNDKLFDSGEVTAVTDSSGLYAFTNLAAGIYYIRQILPSGWNQSYPVNNYSQKITLNTGVNITQRNFGTWGSSTNPDTGSIKGTLWNDLDHDGVWDSIEVGIAGRTVYIDADHDNSLDSGEVTTTTDSAGLYTFSNLPAGTYYIRQVLPGNWSQSSPSSNASQIVVLTSGANVTGKNFGSYTTTSTGTGSIKGTVWNDLDHDGIWDSNESGIPNRTVFIDADNDKVFDPGEVTAVTNSAGLYTFSNLVAGLYYIRQILPSGWNQSSPVNNYSQKISLNTGVNISQRNFGTYQFSSSVIDPNGRVFFDDNRNGQADLSEPGASGQAVFADFDNDGRRDPDEPQAITGNDGRWEITGLSSTTPVNIRLIVPNLWTQTSPRYDAPIIANTSASAPLNFGVVAPVTDQRSSFLPGEAWFDTAGNLINAHAGSILKHDGIYYWYGENHPFTDPSLDVRYANGFNVYQSTDLYNWTLLGSALDTAPADSGSDIALGQIIERPRVVYNDSTGKFVMWFHVDESDYLYARAGVAVSDSPAGPFNYLGSIRPLGYESRDITLYKDTDGSAYIAFASKYNNQINRAVRIVKLSDDYLTPMTQMSVLLDSTQREAPSIFKKDGRYYMLTSGCDWWNPTAARVHTTTSLGGSWTSLGNPATGDMAEFTYNSQGTNVLQVTGNAGQPEFIFLADRWNAAYLPQSRYLWLPFAWQGDSPKLNEPAAWDRSVFG